MARPRCKKMQKFLLLSIFLLFVTSLIKCHKPQAISTQSPDEIKNVSVVLLSQSAWAAQYENQKVGFTARFERISSEFGRVGLEHYQFTHFLTSLVSPEENATLYALIPAYSEILASLRPGDLVKVQGILHVGKNDTVYVFVKKLTRL